ncbi:MAG TPA: hypothetical protein VGO47_05920, partial [Chlamydiales bacterium]|nr:hypothetical protein [Chlamydiales bacterium]
LSDIVLDLQNAVAISKLDRIRERIRVLTEEDHTPENEATLLNWLEKCKRDYLCQLCKEHGIQYIAQDSRKQLAELLIHSVCDFICSLICLT